MVSMHRHHDMSFVTVLMLMPIKSASLFSQHFRNVALSIACS